MSSEKRPSALPVPEAARIDHELQGKIQNLVSGHAQSGDASAISRLIRRRADLMMPAMLREKAKAG